ncbi:unnamed protein product [Agarophyton chilense]
MRCAQPQHAAAVRKQLADTVSASPSIVNLGVPVPLHRFAMLRRSLVPLQRLASRSLSTPARRPHMHLPLGAVPDDTDLQSVRSKWGSDAMEKIQSTDIIEVDADVAVCNGGGGALGHPIEYIKLYVSDEHAGPQVCKYCGLKFARKNHH